MPPSGHRSERCSVWGLGHSNRAMWCGGPKSQARLRPGSASAVTNGVGRHVEAEIPRILFDEAPVHFLAHLPVSVVCLRIPGLGWCHHFI